MKIKEYLDKYMINNKRFADSVGINPVTFCKIVYENTQPKLKVAIAIEKVTEGKVSVYDWCNDTDNEIEKKDQPRKIAKLNIKNKVKSKAVPKITVKTRNSGSS